MDTNEIFPLAVSGDHTRIVDYGGKGRQHMEKSEYWILEAAVEVRWPLAVVAHWDHQAMMNRKTHGMPLEQLMAVFRRLFDLGYLAGRRQPVRETDQNDNDPLEVAYFVPNDGELLAGLQGVRPIDFGLTEKGGATWETLSKPNWSQYVASLAIGVYASHSREVLEEYALMTRHWSGAHRVGFGIEAVQPFQATYWKSFPIGYRLTFIPPRGEDVFIPDQRENAVYRAWFKRVRSGWYTNPCE